MMPDDPKQWAVEVKSWCIQNKILPATVEIFPEERYVDFKNNVDVGSVNAFSTKLPFKIRNAYGNFRFSQIAGRVITSLENCPDYVADDFDCDELSLTTMKHFPKSVGGGYFSCNKKLLPSEYRYLLLSNITGEIDLPGGQGVGMNEKSLLIKCLMDGRDGGQMPSELIPGKIRQLKEMDSKW